MKKQFFKENSKIIIAALLFTLLAYSTGSIINSKKLSLRKVTESSAQTSCDTSFFTISSPSGTAFSKNCIVANAQIYSTDTRYLFFQPQTNFANAATIRTPNTEIKDNVSLSWSINLTKPSTLYVLPRHIPGLNAPAWITNNYTRSTNNDLSQIAQYFKRKNDQGLIGIYDVFSKDVGAGTVNLYGASDTQNPGYSMYIVALVPIVGPATPVPTRTGSPLPTRSASPSPSGSTNQPPANLLAIAQQHVRPPTDCWTLYKHPTDGWHLYNVSDYFSVTIGSRVIKQHPGSDGDLAWACGKDMTDVFNKGARTAGVSGHGDKAHLSKSSAMTKLKSLQVPGY